MEQQPQRHKWRALRSVGCTPSWMAQEHRSNRSAHTTIHMEQHPLRARKSAFLLPILLLFCYYLLFHMYLMHNISMTYDYIYRNFDNFKKSHCNSSTVYARSRNRVSFLCVNLNYKGSRRPQVIKLKRMKVHAFYF